MANSIFQKKPGTTRNSPMDFVMAGIGHFDLFPRGLVIHFGDDAKGIADDANELVDGIWGVRANVVHLVPAGSG